MERAARRRTIIASLSDFGQLYDMLPVIGIGLVYDVNKPITSAFFISGKQYSSLTCLCLVSLIFLVCSIRLLIQWACLRGYCSCSCCSHSLSLSLYPAAAEIARQVKWPTCAASDLSFSSSADATAASDWETAGSWAAVTEIARVELGSTALADTHSLLLRADRP